MPTINVRWADNTAELKARLKEGIGTLDAMRSAVDKTVQSMGGQGLFRAAHNVTAAIIEMGGATKLTIAEQTRHVALLEKAIEKYRVMGQTAPPAMREIAAEMRRLADASGFMEKHTVGATDFLKKYAAAAAPAVGVTQQFGAASKGLFGQITDVHNAVRALLGLQIVKWLASATTASLDYAAGLDKMRATTDISFRGLQQLENIAVGSNTSFQSLTSSVLDLQRKLSTGDDSAVGAIRKLGFETGAFLKLKGDEQFLEISRALGQMGNETERNTTAFALFGRGYKEILSALTSDVDKLKDSVRVMSDAQIQRLADVETKWKQLGLEIKRATVDLVENATTFTGFAGTVFHFRDEQTQLWWEYWDAVRGNVGPLPDTAKSKAGGPQLPTLLTPNPLLPLATQEQFLKEDLQRLEAARNKANAIEAAALKKSMEAWEEYRSTVGSIHKQLSGDTIEGIKFDLARGQSQSVLAEVYGVTAAQVKAIAEEMEGLKKFEAMKFEGLKGIENLGIQMDPLKDILGAAMITMHDFAYETNSAGGEIAKLGIQVKPSVDDLVRLWKAAGMSAVEIERLKKAWGDAVPTFTDVLGSIPELLIKAFTGGGGIEGAIRASAVRLGEHFANDLKASIANNLKLDDDGRFVGGLSGAGFKAAGAIGATIGIGAAASGASGKQAAGAVVGSAVQAGMTASTMGASIAGSVALGVATAGIGLAAVGAYYGLKKLFTISKEIKEARGEQDKLLAAFREMGAVGTDFKVLSSTIGNLWRDLGRDGESARQMIEILMDTDNPARFAAAVREVNAALAEQKTRWEGTQEAVADLNAFTKDGVDSLGKYNIAVGSAVAIFDAWVKKTGDVAGALEQIGPALDAIAKGQTDLGFAGNAAIDQLLGLRKVTEAHKPLMENIGQSTRLLTSLGKAGLLTNELVTAFGQNAVNQFTLLKGATGNAKSAMVLMQPELQALWEHQEKFGKFADEATQALIDQAETEGLVGPEMKSDQDKLLGVMKEIRDTLREIAGITIPDKTFKVTPEVEPIDIPDFPTRTQPDHGYASTGGLVTAFGIQRFAGGGVVHGLRSPQYLGVGGIVGMSSLYQPRGTDTVPIMATPGELVLTDAQQNGLDNRAVVAELRALRAEVRRLEVRADTVVQIDGREIARANVKAWDNGSSITEAREVLGVP